MGGGQERTRKIRCIEGVLEAPPHLCSPVRTKSVSVSSTGVEGNGRGEYREHMAYFLCDPLMVASFTSRSARDLARVASYSDFWPLVVDASVLGVGVGWGLRGVGISGRTKEQRGYILVSSTRAIRAKGGSILDIRLGTWFRSSLLLAGDLPSDDKLAHAVLLPRQKNVRILVARLGPRRLGRTVSVRPEISCSPCLTTTGVRTAT